MTIVKIILKKWGNNGSSIFYHCSNFIEFFDKTDITTLKNNREMELAGNSNVGKTIIRASPTNFILFKFHFTSIHNYCIIPLNRRMIGRSLWLRHIFSKTRGRGRANFSIAGPQKSFLGGLDIRVSPIDTIPCTRASERIIGSRSPFAFK